MSHSTEKIEFGDFQTPDELAQECCKAIARDFGSFPVVIEPTCGKGSFVAAAMSVFSPESVYANEIDPVYLTEAKQRFRGDATETIQWSGRDFFTVDWREVRKSLGDQPALFIGNPPWVTNSQIGRLGGSNLPAKRNIDGLSGIQALTGHGNFDISEYILRTILQAMNPKTDALGFLVKSATARKLVKYAWDNAKFFSSLAFYQIDAKKEFGVSADAVLVAGSLNPFDSDAANSSQRCLLSKTLAKSPTSIAMGWVDGKIVCDPDGAISTRHLAGVTKGVWRSGVKHDASKILEFRKSGMKLINGLKREVELETDRVFPLMKGSDVANGRQPIGDKFALVTQFGTNEDTSELAESLPLTFNYLADHSEAFARRKSSIYRNRDRFAIFGVGAYTFKPWKVAICGLYKRLQFTVYGPYQGQPVVFDDTVYFLACNNEEQARFVEQLLCSEPGIAFLQARVFWDSKRPITVDLLQSLNLRALAEHNKLEHAWSELKMDQLLSPAKSTSKQLQMFTG